ncbi:MAG: inner membrane protein [Parcubacteria group bacterium Gr01-1014_30]|nr:MAG: inner membrane protein [Parcubacteria group bacterium Gr01-1014_30]
MHIETLYFLFFVFLIAVSGRWIVDSLMRVARYLGWKEFVVAFFVMAIAASLPNLFVGISSAFKGIPQLSFGDVAGNNLVALTLAVALAVLFAKDREIPAESRTVRATSFFTLAAAVFPLILTLDGTLSRIDGIALIGLFVVYIVWLFSKKERFVKTYDGTTPVLFAGFRVFLQDLGKIILGVALLLLASQGIVAFAQLFAQNLGVSIILIGVLITGFGSALPEVYFALVSARRGETWMILGDLMGAVIVPTTLVLGIVALIHPIEILDFSPFAVARVFLVAAAMFFLFFVRSHRKITPKEGIFLLSLYIAFLIVEILVK